MGEGGLRKEGREGEGEGRGGRMEGGEREREREGRRGGGREKRRRDEHTVYEVGMLMRGCVLVYLQS